MTAALPRCVAVLRSKHSSDRGKPCGRVALHVDASGAPVCGLHEPTALAKRIALVRVERRSSR